MRSLFPALTLLAACAPDPERLPPPVILISLDTVRADELSCYGGPEGTTPVLDAFAAEGTRYAACVSSAPWTLPSHASMFTGLDPTEHGTHSFEVPAGYRGDNVFALAPRFETLAEALAARGYRTGGIVANSIYLRPGLGLEQGFETWDVQRNRAGLVTRRALDWLDAGGDSSRPTFLFVNYLDAHRPYRTGDPADRARAKLDELIDAVMVKGGDAPELSAEVAALHQKAVTALDAELADLFDGLRERDLYDRALIIVTSDHGEAFGDHGVVEHSKDVYGSLVRVPLLVKPPGGGAGDVLGRRASSIDVPGLVAAALAGTDAESLRSVFPETPGSHPVVAENHFSRVRDLEDYGDRFRRVRQAWYEGTEKLVRGTDGSLELYDLESDPDERTNLADERPERARELAARLDAHLEAHAFDGERALPAGLTERQQAELGALGYGPSAPSGDDR